MQVKLVVCIVAFLSSSAVTGLDEDVIVETIYGKIHGVTTFASNGKTIYSFKNIPFAKPPYRFEPPRPLNPLEDSWGNETRDGTKNPPSCAQWLTNLSPASEDCLYLNVHMPIKPAASSGVKLPVMVFIYGGANVFGDAVLYGPNRLMGHDDVILVVIQYRLGALGWLSTGDHVVPGNNGLKDQREALRWVQGNIESFNGDKDQVTIFGESAGASAVIAQLLSPSTKGLFHKVIAQSGTPIAPWARDANPKESAERFARSVSCTEYTNTAEMVSCLEEKDWVDLAKASVMNLLTDFSTLKVNFGALAPVVEPDHDGAFFTRDPLEILKDGDFPHIPVILGANQHEGSILLGLAYAMVLGNNGQLEDPSYVRHELVPTLLNSISLGDELIGGPISQSLADYYFPEDASKDNFTQITDGLVDMLSVVFFKGPILLTADYLSQFSNQTYLYSFEHEGFGSIWTLTFDLISTLLGRDPPPIKHGVMHADDLMYFWTLPFVITGKDRQFSDMVCRMWTDFAVTSNPTPGYQWPSWERYTTLDPKYYKLDLQPELLIDYTKNWRKSSHWV